MDSQKEPTAESRQAATGWPLEANDALPPDADEGRATPAPVSIERRQELERLIRTAPADASLYQELADSYCSEERYFDAIRVLEKAVALHADDAQLRWRLEEAQLARILQRVRETRKLFEETGSRDAAEDLERCQIEWGVRRAEICKARLARDPDQPGVSVRLGEAQRDLGQPREAIASVAAVLTNPEHGPAAALVTAQCQQALGNPIEALTFYRAAGMRRSRPAAPAIRIAAMRGASTLAAQLGLVASGLRYARLWSELAPNDPDAAATQEHLQSLNFDSNSSSEADIEEMPNASSDR